MTGRPPTIRFVPFDAADYLAWLALAIPSYALSHVEIGQWTPAQALQQSTQAHASLLPEGHATPGHTFVRLHIPGEEGDVGHLWWAETEEGGRAGAYVYGLEVEERARRRGVARAAFAELERIARARDLFFVSLHVFGRNRAARRLYEGLGFEPTNITMRKDLR
ncbi:MAG: GNAT family N-acetyltransferase [Burkholderiaceae bacterium]